MSHNRPPRLQCHTWDKRIVSLLASVTLTTSFLAAATKGAGRSTGANFRFPAVRPSGVQFTGSEAGNHQATPNTKLGISALQGELVPNTKTELFLSRRLRETRGSWRSDAEGISFRSISGIVYDVGTLNLVLIAYVVAMAVATSVIYPNINDPSASRENQLLLNFYTCDRSCKSQKSKHRWFLNINTKSIFAQKKNLQL